MCRMESRLSRLIGSCMSVLIICTILAEANDTYVLTSLLSTWDNACSGNGPAVIDGIQFYPVKFPPNLLSTIGSVRAWIGYYQRFGYFNLLGCLSVIAESSLSLIDNTPGRCATACGSCNYIGLEDDICHCLKETDLGTSHFKNAVTCSMKMCNGTHFFCGTRGQMWVYGVNNGNTTLLDQLATSSNNENRCLSAHYNAWSGGAVWKFSSCMDHHKSLCELNNTVLDYDTYGLSSPAPWDEAVKHCFNKSETPARFEYNYWRRYNVQNFDEAWTAYIRDEIIQKQESESIPKGRIRCLSLSMSEGKPEVHFENCEDNLPAVCLAGITPRTTTTTTTTTAATTTSIITTIRSTTSAEVAPSSWSKVASSSSTTSALSSRPFADIKTPTSSESQFISGNNSVSSTSIGINQSNGSTQALLANKSEIVNNDFPMFGRIGLGISVVLIIAVIVLVIQRCKKKRIDKGIYCSDQTSVEPSDHTSGMKLSDSVKLDVMNFKDNEMHKADKDTSDVCDRQPNSDYYTIHIDDKACQETGRVLCDIKDQSYDYATVDISKKGVPKLI